jgi:hypothetical protein
MALIALDIPAPEWPEPSIEETISRAYLNERNEAAPLRQVRRSALPCKACGPAAALLSLCACLHQHQVDKTTCCSHLERVQQWLLWELLHPMILQLRLAITDPLSGEGHHSNGAFK